MNHRTRHYWTATAVAILLTPSLVAAQASIATNGRNLPITEKPRPDYDPLGIRSGAFLVKPQITLGLSHNDNLYTVDNNTTSAWYTTLAPRLVASSGWSRHGLDLAAGVEAARYNGHSDEDYLNADLLLKGRLDVQRGSWLTGTLGVQRLHEERGSPEFDSAWAEPVRYHRQQAGISAFHGAGRASLSGGVELQTYDFRDVKQVGGGSESQAHRDRKVYEVNGRFAYESTPEVHPFLSLKYQWRNYDNDSGKHRDSEGYRIGIGTGFAPTGALSGEVFIGYMQQDYKEDTQQDISGAWYGASVLWSPSELTSLQFDAGSSIQETIAANASGIRSANAGVRVDHELLRNLLVGAFANHTRDDYQGIDRNERYNRFGPRVTYLWNRNLSAEMEYTHTERSAHQTSEDYTQGVFMLRLVARM